MGGVWIGTSGWNYPPWRTGFFAGVPRRAWLSHYATRFPAVEVNATFYRLPTPETVARWRDETPEGFRFSVKGHRDVTHRRRLRDVDEPVGAQREALASLGDRLAVVLWQLPAKLERDDERLAGLVRALAAWPGVRHVVEFRHESWFDDAVAARLEAAGVGSAISDAPRWPRWEAVAAGTAYVRLHGAPELYSSPYPPSALDGWAERVRTWLARGCEAHVYFDNTMHGAAPGDAAGLLERLARG